MKKFYLLLLIICIFVISCGNHFFNPRYYYNKNNRGTTASSTEEEAPPDLGGGDENLSEDEDPFKKPEVNDLNANGFTLDLDNMVIEASFDKSNRPTYKLVPGKWIPGSEGKNDYYYDGPNTTAAGYSMSSVKYYMYKQKNPTYDINSAYNQSSRMERFYFYKFYGEYLSVGSANYLIAIDKYTKLVFAFAIPTKWKDMLVRNAPETWGAVELGWEADGNITGSVKKIYFAVDGITYFYEYDPVGIVRKDGTIEIYQWCSDSIGLRNLYAPQFDGTVGDTSRPVATYNTPGRSPYMPLKVANTEASEEDANKFKDDMKTLSGQEYKYRDYSGYTATKPADKGQISDLTQWVKDYAGKSLTLYTYSLTDNGETITIKQNHFTEGDKGSVTYKLSMVNSSTKATYTNVNNPNDAKSVILMKDEAGTTIEALSVDGIAIDFTFVDYGPLFADRVRGTHFKRDSEITIGAGIGSFTATFPSSWRGALKELEYTFNEDGTEFTMKYKYDDGIIFTSWVTKEYHFKLARFDADADKNWTAKYECLDLSGTLGNYTRVVLRNGEGTSNPGPNEIGTVIRSSMTLHDLSGIAEAGDLFAVPDDPTSNLGLDMISDKR